MVMAQYIDEYEANQLMAYRTPRYAFVKYTDGARARFDSFELLPRAQDPVIF